MDSAICRPGVPFRKKPLAEKICAITKASLLATLSSTAVSRKAAQDVIEEVIVTAQSAQNRYSLCQLVLQRLAARNLKTSTSTTSEITFLSCPSSLICVPASHQANLFMRGISEGGNSSQSLQGPSVAVYLNEQPVTAIGFNLDPHMYDIQRIEVLKGPQGTLYGAAPSGNLE